MQFAQVAMKTLYNEVGDIMPKRLSRSLSMHSKSNKLTFPFEDDEGEKGGLCTTDSTKRVGRCGHRRGLDEL